MKKIIIALFILTLLIVGCNYAVETKSKVIGSGDPYDKCKLWAQTMSPYKLTLIDRGDWAITELVWNNDVKASEADILGIYYKAGSQTGQNVNYYYPYSTYKDASIKYSRQVIDKDGTILGDNSFSVNLILKPIEGTDGTYQVNELVSYPSKEFDVIEVELVSCNLVDK